MSYLVDSDWLSDYLQEFPDALSVEPLFAEGASVSAITYMETFEGIQRRRPGPEEMARLETVLNALTVIDVSRSIARRCALLRHALRQQGRRVTPRSLDLLIAATALEYDLTLVTRNRQDYQDIPDLALYEHA